MNIIIINTSDSAGGAAIAASRLLQSLTKYKVKSTMLVFNKRKRQNNIETIKTSFIKRYLGKSRFLWERLIIFLCNKFSRKNLFQISIANTGTDITNHPLVKQAEVIHLHWINQGFLSLNDISALISTGKPIVWTLHDLWPATGICHYPGDCERYKTQCKDCPMLIEHPLWDLAKSTFNKKSKINWSKVTFVGCSNWISELAKRSNLLAKANHISIPNPINTDVFKPYEQFKVRQEFNLPLNNPLLLFAAAKLSETRKGASFLVDACQILRKKYNVDFEILLMGGQSEELIKSLPYSVHSLGYFDNEESIAKIYSCADLFVTPSLEDNLPNTIMESMACGIPCVGFDTGGIPEMIGHKENGYVSVYKSSDDLAEGIRWVLEKKETLNLSSACLKKVKSFYSEDIIAGKYINLYKKLLEK